MQTEKFVAVAIAHLTSGATTNYQAHYINEQFEIYVRDVERKETYYLNHGRLIWCGQVESGYRKLFAWTRT